MTNNMEEEKQIEEKVPEKKEELSLYKDVPFYPLLKVDKLEVNQIVYDKSSKVRVYLSTNQTITASQTQKVLFDTETFDTNSEFASNRFTPIIAGYYLVNCKIYSNNNTNEYQVHLYKNGGSISAFRNGANSYCVTLTELVYMNGTTDYLEIYVQEIAGANKILNSGSDATVLNIHKIL